MSWLKFYLTILHVLVLNEVAANITKKGHIHKHAFIINLCQEDTGYMCMGVLIKPDWVVTTQECAWQVRTAQFYLVAKNPTTNCSNGERRDYEEVFFESINFTLPTHNIALFKVAEPYQLDENVTAIKLSSESHTIDDFEPCYYYSYFYGIPFQLNTYKIKIIPNKECVDVFQNETFNHEEVVCGWSTFEAVISPTVCKGKLYGFVANQQMRVIEIIRIAPKIDWMRDIMELDSGHPSYIYRNRFSLALFLLFIYTLYVVRFTIKELSGLARRSTIVTSRTVVIINYQPHHYQPQQSQAVHYKYLINICHRKFGHICLGSYIDQYWILIPSECAWNPHEEEYIRLMADNPTLDCVHGQYRKPYGLFLPSRLFLDKQHRIALIEINDPFVMGSEMINVTEVNTPSKLCSMYIYNFDYELEDFTLKPVDVMLTDYEPCKEFFMYGVDSVRDIMVCGIVSTEVSIIEMVDLKGISPVVCNDLLEGFVVASNHSVVIILRIAYQREWIKYILAQPHSVYYVSSSVLVLIKIEFWTFLVGCTNLLLR